MKQLLPAIALLSFAAPVLAKDGKPPNLDLIRNFSEIYRIVQNEYITEPDESKLFAACYKGMLGSLDDKSAYIDEQTYRELTENASPTKAGTGLHLQSKAGLPYIVGVTVGSPAARAGIKPKGYVLSIDGASTEDLDFNTAIERLQGAPDSVVRLGIRNYGDIEEREFKLTREVVKASPVDSRLLDRNVAYLRLSTFGESTLGEFLTAYHSLKKQSQGKLRGLILDLRGSTGGGLIQVLDLSSMFFQEHVVVTSLKGRLPDSNQTIYADQNLSRDVIAKDLNWPPELAKLPLVVLVDANTSSGSEILVGAVKDHKRGTIIGQKTMGIGTVQTLRRLGRNIVVKLTTAKYSTPAGREIEGEGIEPDITVPQGSQGDAPWINKALEQFR